MTFTKDEKRLEQDLQKSKSEAQIKKEVIKSSELTKSRPKSAKKKVGKATKLQLKEKKHFAVVDQEPIVEMLAEDMKDRVQQLTPQIQTEDWCSKRLSDASHYKDDRTTMKPSRLSSSLVLNKTMSSIGVGQQKRKPFIRERISDSAVQGNVSTIKMNVSGSQYVYGSGLPDKSYLNITSKHWN